MFNRAGWAKQKKVRSFRLPPKTGLPTKYPTPSPGSEGYDSRETTPRLRRLLRREPSSVWVRVRRVRGWKKMSWLPRGCRGGEGGGFLEDEAKETG